jgi:hypothetical protein
MHRVRRLFARQRFTASRTQQTFAAAEVSQRTLRRGSPTER